MTTRPASARPARSNASANCGSTLTVNDWNWKPIVPPVTGVDGLSGTFDGGTPITVHGSGFTSGATVNFVNTDPLAQVNNPSTQQIYAATNVNVVNAQTITAPSPSVTTLANYYITVTTPGAARASCSRRTRLHYQSVAPNVTERHADLGVHHARDGHHDQRKWLHQRRHRDDDSRERRNASSARSTSSCHRRAGRLEQRDHGYHLSVHHRWTVVLRGRDHAQEVRVPIPTNAVFTFTTAPP